MESSGRISKFWRMIHCKVLVKKVFAISVYKYMFIVENLGEFVLESLFLQLHEPDFLSVCRTLLKSQQCKLKHGKENSYVYGYANSEIIPC